MKIMTFFKNLLNILDIPLCTKCGRPKYDEDNSKPLCVLCENEQQFLPNEEVDHDADKV